MIIMYESFSRDQKGSHHDLWDQTTHLVVDVAVVPLANGLQHGLYLDHHAYGSLQKMGGQTARTSNEITPGQFQAVAASNSSQTHVDPKNTIIFGEIAVVNYFMAKRDFDLWKEWHN